MVQARDIDGHLVAGQTTIERHTASNVVYVNGLYENDVTPSPDNSTRYYYFGGKRIAVRDNSGLRYLLSDHLGSTVTTCDPPYCANPQQASYYAFGEARGSTSGLATHRLYTARCLTSRSGCTTTTPAGTTRS